MRIPLRYTIVAAALFLLAGPALGAQEDRERDYEIAVTKGQYDIELENYASAIAHLKKALSLKPGDQTARVSLGIAYSRSGDLQNARSVLQEAVSADAQDARAAYELAVVFGRIGQQAEAERLMAQVAKAAQDSDLRAAAAVYSADETGGPKKPHLSVAGALQYDSNVILAEDNPITPPQGKQSDVRAVLMLDALYPFLSSAKGGAEAGYHFYQSLHRDLTDFNVQEHDLGLAGEAVLSPETRIGVTYDFLYALLGGDHYSTLHVFAPWVTMHLAPSSLTELHGSYTIKRFINSDLFTDIAKKSGANTAIGLSHSLVFGPAAGASVDYTYDQDATDAPYWDYTGNRISASGLAGIGGFRVFATASYHDRRYGGVPPGASEKRHDGEQEYVAGISRKLGGAWTVSLSDSYTINDSTIPFYQYTRNVIGIFAEIRL